MITSELSEVINMTLHEHRDAPIQEVYCHMIFLAQDKLCHVMTEAALKMSHSALETKSC